MLYISDNLKWLRNRRTWSQQQVADAMKFGLDQYKKYEYGKNTPPAEALVVISRFYSISIDLLLTVDLRKVCIDSLLKLENNRILLPITVDKAGENIIEVIPYKARAGYAAGGYADFTFISELDHISVPGLAKNEKYRAFPIDGDSMPPHTNQSYIIGKYVEKLGDVTDGKTYIVVTKNQEMVYKRLNKNGKNTFALHSDNDFYASYDIKFSDIAEIWQYVSHIGKDDTKQETTPALSVEQMFLKLSNEIKEVKERLV